MYGKKFLLSALLAAACVCPGTGEAARYVSDAEEQVRLIASQRAVWDLASPPMKETAGFLVTDMDHNGRLEIWVSQIGGTGSYSDSQVYEVNERKDALVPCGFPWGENESQPDVIIRNQVLSYTNGVDGDVWYIFMDQGKEGHLPRESYWALSLQGGNIHEKFLGKREYYFIREGQLGSSCYNEDGKKIPDLHYMGVGGKAFPYSELKWVHWAWLIYHRWDWAEWEAKDEEDVYFMLLDTYLNFTGEKEGMG